MHLEIGNIVEGKVLKITKFGAFIELEPKISGLVHISEISQQFVVDISKFLEVGSKVKVKILNNENGKISLSIKQAQELKPKQNSNKNKTQSTQKQLNENPIIFNKQSEKATNLSFEEMLNKFKKNSEEKLSDIKRNSENRRSSYSRRR